MKLCSHPGCPRPRRSLGFCPLHYRRLLTTGTTELRGFPHVDFGPLDDASASILAARYGVSRRTIVRWRRDGVPARITDRLAAAAGCHPLELWPDLYAEEAA